MTFQLINKIIDIFRLNPDYDKRIFGLDIMRAYAIIVVVMGHARMLNAIQTDYPWIKFMNGVELFFVLSGFLIGSMLIRIYERSENFGWREIVNFWVRRWFRTIPCYYLILMFNIFMVHLVGRTELIDLISWKYFLFVQNFSSYFFGFFTESWSLSIEEWFYFLFPLIILLLHWILRFLKIEGKYIILASIFAFLIIPFLLRYFIASAYVVDNFWLELKINRVVIFRLDSIAFGILAAYLFRWHANVWMKYKIPFFILGIIINYYLLYSDFTVNTTWVKVFNPLILSIGCALLLPLLNSIKSGPKLLARVITYISLASYSMYLLNMPAASILTRHFPPRNAFEAWTLYFVYWFVTIACSVLLYKYFEKPVMDIRDRFGKPVRLAYAPKPDIKN